LETALILRCDGFQVAAAEEKANKSLKAQTDALEDAAQHDSQPNGSNTSTSKLESSKPEAFNISNTEAVRRLRAKDQPIRLFGETDKERRLRLRALELIEERTEGQRNDFMRALEGMDKGLDLEELQRRTGNPVIDRLKAKEGSATPGPDTDGEGGSASDAATPGTPAVNKEDEPVDLSLVKKNPNKLYPQIYFGIKKVLKEWEASMAERPGTPVHSSA
jgi:pre-mRNA-splicing factor 18